jgi:hypothetical protein
MLRAALGLPPALVSREHAPTERIYGTLPFFSEQMAKRRVAFFGHALREHERGVHHRVIDMLQYSSKRKREKEWTGGGRRTVTRGLMLDCRVDHIDALVEILRNRAKCRKAAHDAAVVARETRIQEIMKRRPEGFVYPEYGKGPKATKTPAVVFKTLNLKPPTTVTYVHKEKSLDEMSEEELRLMMM